MLVLTLDETDEYLDLVHDGLDLLDNESVETAREYFEELMTQYPNFGSTYVFLGGIYRELKMYDASERTLRKAVELNEDDTFSLSQLGFTLSCQGWNREAEDIFRKVLKKEPDDVGVLVGLAEALLGTDLLDEALTHLERGLDIEPDNYWVWLGLGKVYCDKGEHEKAIPYFEHAAQLDGDNPYPLRRIGDARLYLGDFEQGRMMYERALELEPEYYEAKKGYAESLLRLKKYSEAEDLLRDMIDENLSDCELWMLRGYVHLNLGDLQQAEDHFNESLTRYSNEVEAHKGLLIIYEKMDRVEEAERIRGKIRQLTCDADIEIDTDLANIDPEIHGIIKELNALGLHVHSAYSGLGEYIYHEDAPYACIVFWADYKDAPHHIFTICSMALWYPYYEDNCIAAVWGGEHPSEIRDGWARLLQMARLVMPKLDIHIGLVQEKAWERDLRDEPEQDKD